MREALSTICWLLSQLPRFFRCLLLRRALPKCCKDVVYGSRPRCRADVFNVATVTELRHRRVLLFVHGGAWGFGDTWMHADMALVFPDFAVVTINYSLWPAGGIDDAVDDVATGLVWLHSLVGGSVVTVVAHSAGAHLVAEAIRVIGKGGGAACRGERTARG